MEKTEEKEPWFGSTWAEFFISVVLARIVQATLLPGFGMIFLVPITWLVIHILLGKWIKEKADKDIFGRNPKTE